MVAPEQGRGGLRASDADREQAIDVLKAAFVQGRLARAEFEARVGQALASRTYAELAAATDGIPGRLTADTPPGMPARVREQRTQREMSQNDLAQALGVSRHTVISIENGWYLPSLPLALDSTGRWHAARPDHVYPHEGDYALTLRLVPPLARSATWIEVLAAGRSAEVRARLPVHWQ
jgi:DNA-binding XRE family transcriptional regulator